MSNSEFTANRELANTPPRSRPARVVLAELAAHARAAERARRKAIRTAITGTIAGALLAAGAVLLAFKIGADIAYWKAERNAAVEALK